MGPEKTLDLCAIELSLLVDCSLSQVMTLTTALGKI